MKIASKQKKSKILNKKNNSQFIPFILALIFLGAVVFASQYSAEAAPASTLYFNPANVAVTGGQTFSLDAVINPSANQVSAVELHITFDATRFQLTNIVNNPSAFSQILQSANINNTNGTASIVLGAPLTNPPSPITSTTTVATFSFNATGANGTSPIGFASGTQAAAIGEASNVIISQDASQITIGRKYGNNDFSVLATDWLQTKESSADVDADGTINAKDLGIMMSNWGN